MHKKNTSSSSSSCLCCWYNTMFNWCQCPEHTSANGHDQEQYQHYVWSNAPPSRKVWWQDHSFKKCFIETLKKNVENVELYTGKPSFTMLLGIFNIFAVICSALKYCSSQPSAQEKNYQRNRHGKHGPAKKSSFSRNLFLNMLVYFTFTWVLYC